VLGLLVALVGLGMAAWCRTWLDVGASLLFVLAILVVAYGFALRERKMPDDNEQ
jgi:hypothetical protein